MIGAASRADFLVAAFFLPSTGRAARMVFFNGRPCEGTRKGAPVLSRYANLARSATLHWREGRQVFDLLIGAIMADTTARKPGTTVGNPTSTATHTPAPWAWHGYALRAVTPDPEGSAVQTILEVESCGNGYPASDHTATRAELDADHRLIAAAPALHAALVQARAALVQALGIVDAALLVTATQRGVL